MVAAGRGSRPGRRVAVRVGFDIGSDAESDVDCGSRETVAAYRRGWKAGLTSGAAALDLAASERIWVRAGHPRPSGGSAGHHSVALEWALAAMAGNDLCSGYIVALTHCQAH